MFDTPAAFTITGVVLDCAETEFQKSFFFAGSISVLTSSLGFKVVCGEVVFVFVGAGLSVSVVGLTFLCVDLSLPQAVQIFGEILFNRSILNAGQSFSSDEFFAIVYD